MNEFWNFVKAIIFFCQNILKFLIDFFFMFIFLFLFFFSYCKADSVLSCLDTHCNLWFKTRNLLMRKEICSLAIPWEECGSACIPQGNFIHAAIVYYSLTILYDSMAKNNSLIMLKFTVKTSLFNSCQTVFGGFFLCFQDSSSFFFSLCSQRNSDEPNWMLLKNEWQRSPFFMLF